MSILIQNARIITPTVELERGWLYAQDKSITSMGVGAAPVVEDGPVIDAQGRFLLPGFIDVHVHGAVGCEAMDATPEALRSMAEFYAQHGVTAFLPSTWTDSPERILAALEVIATQQGAQPNGATILGAHVEGPYLNPEKSGAQNSRYVRRASRTETTPWFDLDVVRLLALAPEYEENHWLIQECVQRGITVSVAHTAANYEDMQEAFALGVTHSTHTYNAMTGLHHRKPGVLGAVMTEPRVYCELIADNIHVHPAAIQILFAVKGVDRIILITDAIRGAGMPEGSYAIDERTIHIRGTTARLPDGTLAGSVLTMDRALANLMQATRRPLSELWKTSSFNAARSIHLSHQKGSLEVGKDADLVLVDDNIEVFLTVAEGRMIYQKNVRFGG